ncbi:MAG: type 1 glutamine amidotransferase [Mycobacterium sp.]
MPRKVLFLYNDPTAPAALLGDAFAENGFDIDTFEVVPADRADDPVFDVTFPEVGDYDVIVPLGARWAVYDERLADSWVAAEIDLVRSALAAGSGVLGVCFGGQLLAQALGGEVSRSPHPEIGWYEVHSDRPALVPHGPWFQWHFDRFSLPAGAVEVARNLGTTQAFVQGRALGLQFHPEVDHALAEDWIAGDLKPGGDSGIAELGLDAGEIRARAAVELDDAARRLRLLVRGFLALLDKDPQHDVHSLR